MYFRVILHMNRFFFSIIVYAPPISFNGTFKITVQCLRIDLCIYISHLATKTTFLFTIRIGGNSYIKEGTLPYFCTSYTISGILNAPPCPRLIIRLYDAVSFTADWRDRRFFSSREHVFFPD